MSNHQHLLSANNLVLLVVGVLYWISASANGQCLTSDDCIAPSGLTRCNVTSGQCDCTFANFRHGLICDKVCTDTGLKGHCIKGVCNQSDFSFDLYFGLCKCDRGWSEDDTGRCTIPTCNRPCQNGGACVEPNKCRCVDGFTGDQCEMKLRCTMLPTPDRGRTALDMQNGIQYQTFDCDDGYVVNGSRVSICENSRWNPPTPPTCVDQDECSAGLHQCERHCGMCKNTLGSYVCNVSPENADLVYDAEKGRCCQRGEACGEISCFPYQQLSFGTLRYSRPLWSTTAKVAVLTSVSVECDASRGLRLPDNAVTTVKCTKSGLYDNILSDCLPPPTQDPAVSVFGTQLVIGAVSVGGGDAAVSTRPVIPAVGDVEDVESSRSGGDTALIASLVTVTIVIILVVLLFVYFRARNPQHKYAAPPSSPSPPPAPQQAGKKYGLEGKGPQMHGHLPAAMVTASAPPAVLAKRGRTLDRIVDDHNIYASPETVDGAATTTTAGGIPLATTAPSACQMGSTDVIVESQHYASCDLQEEDTYEDACSVSPAKAFTLPSSLPAQPSFLGVSDSKQADTLPAVSPSRNITTASSIAAAAAMKKSHASGGKQQAPKTQRPLLQLKQQRQSSVVRQTAALNSDSEYENPSNSTSPPSSPPFNHSKRTRAALIHSFQQHAQQQPMRPQSTSPPAIVSDSSPGSSVKSSSPLPDTDATISPKDSMKGGSRKPQRPPRAPPALPDVDAVLAPASNETQESSRSSDKPSRPQLPSKDNRPQLNDDAARKPYIEVKPSEPPPTYKETQLSAKTSYTLVKPSQPPPPAPAPAGEETTTSSDEPDGVQQAVEQSRNTSGPPRLPSKVHRPKLDDTETDSLSRPVESVKPSTAPKPHSKPISPSKSFDSEDGYLSPTEDIANTSSAKPAPPPKRGRPSLATRQESEDSVLSRTDTTKPTPPPKRDRPVMTHSASKEEMSQIRSADEDDGDRTSKPRSSPLKASSSSSSTDTAGPRMAPPRTASMPRFPSPLPSLPSDNAGNR
eukprot:scpid24172/ scgid30078/ Nephronectin; Preosteoblast EGF-like repeat protein with MAM domain